MFETALKIPQYYFSHPWKSTNILCTGILLTVLFNKDFLVLLMAIWVFFAAGWWSAPAGIPLPGWFLWKSFLLAPREWPRVALHCGGGDRHFHSPVGWQLRQCLPCAPRELPGSQAWRRSLSGWPCSLAFFPSCVPGFWRLPGCSCDQRRGAGAAGPWQEVIRVAREAGPHPVLLTQGWLQPKPMSQWRQVLTDPWGR